MMRHGDIAICSLSCRYPDASTPEALWSNVLEGRRSFRALPPDRLDLTSYRDERAGGHDSITPIRAGLISDWVFDRAGFRIPRSTYHAADPTHWLALSVAAQAVEAVGGPDALDRDRVAVVVANTLTGEFSRANSLRLRLPFLDALIAQACVGIELDGDKALALRKEFGAILRDRLAEPNEESLAGGLANTIAGRIANFFDFGGGAYVIDAACASSLVAIADAASLLETEAADAVVAVAVDLSLDPFELVGFSRIGALTQDVMRVFDARSSGFWPGEGAAAAVLVRGGDAAERGLPRVAHLRGWGISTDGAGGLTRPSRRGQLRALERAYAKADADPSDLMMVEAHGTGTAIGDPTEIRALAELVGARREPLPVGSIKANFGHTKAAAGFAGLIKAVYALNCETLPPHVGCEIPHPVFDEVDHRVVPAQGPVSLEPRRNPIAGVSAFGFGGINAHLVIEAAGRRSAPLALPARPRYQDAELFLFDAPTRDELLSRLDAASVRAPRLSMSEFVDLAAQCADRAGQDGFRLAIVASDPDQFRERSETAREAVAAGRDVLNAERGVFIGGAGQAARIGFLFPGQAAPSRLDGGIWARRFDVVGDIIAAVPALGIADPVDTRVAQPAIAAASLAALQLLEACGVEAAAATGHSLGEVTALAWAGAIKREDLVGLAALRAATMFEYGAPGGTMLLVRCPRATCLELMSGLDLVLACENAERENVASGRAEQIAALEERAQRADIGASRLAVSHAFHSPLMAPAAPRFGCALRGYSLRAPARPVFSPTIGRQVGADDNLRKLLASQFVAPVRFEAALSALVDATDLIVEVGPGTGLARLAEVNGSRCLSVDAFAETLVPLLNVLAAAYASGVDLNLAPLFSDRSPRPIDLAARPKFLSNPCGGGAAPIAPVTQALPPDDHPAPAPDGSRSEQALDHLTAVRRAVAEATGLPEDSLTPTLRLLDDLHLNSLAVGRIVAAVCAQLGRTTPLALTDYAGASLEELADNLGELDRLADGGGDDRDTITGVAPWVACFAPVAESAEERPGGSPISWRVQAICGAAERDLTDRSGGAGLTGTLLHLGDWRAPEALTDLWCATRAVVDAGVRNIGFLHSGAPLSAFARSLHQEGLFDSVTVVRSDDASLEQIDRALSSVHPGYNEIILSGDGSRRMPKYVRAAATKKSGRHRPLGRGDVILVTGGTRGIGAECALRLGERLGHKLALCGRSDPDHPEVRQILERAAATGIPAIYRNADVRDPGAIAHLVAAAEEELGPIACVLHAAGVNRPARFENLDLDDLALTRAAKDLGLRNILAALDCRALKCVIAFGSIIGRLGLAGETHYAMANAAQTAVLEDFAADNPGVRTLSFEWSVWAGIGMGERLGTLERLAEYGVEPLSLDDALDTFQRVVSEDLGMSGPLVVAGRYAPMTELLAGHGELPLNRFLETARVHYPAVELVADSVISVGTDPYLLDHCIDDEIVMPGVFALEAMAAAAASLAGESRPTSIRNLRFEQAVSVPKHGEQTLRVAALRRGENEVSCTIRASDDGFVGLRASADVHFAARERAAEAIPLARPAHAPVESDPLYEHLFFNKGRFRLISGFTRLSAFEVTAELHRPAEEPWFGSFLPQHLTLGDPGSRDAGLHALQATIPQRRVIPVAVDEIELFDLTRPRCKVDARQVAFDDSTFVYDIVFRDDAGAIVEKWHRAAFRGIGAIRTDALPEAMLVPWLEREIALSCGRADVRVALTKSQNRARRREEAIAALGLQNLCRRADGRPLILDPSGRGHVSIAHDGEATLVMTADGPIGCDMETGTGGSSAAVSGIDLADWCVTEALRKIGCSPTGLRESPSKVGGQARSGTGYDRDFRLGDIDVIVRCWRSERVIAVALSNPRSQETWQRSTRRPDFAEAYGSS